MHASLSLSIRLSTLDSLRTQRTQLAARLSLFTGLVSVPLFSTRRSILDTLLAASRLASFSSYCLTPLDSLLASLSTRLSTSTCLSTRLSTLYLFSYLLLASLLLLLLLDSLLTSLLLILIYLYTYILD